MVLLRFILNFNKSLPEPKVFVTLREKYLKNYCNMKKFLLLAALALGAAAAAKAQDVIIMRSGEETQAIVQEIGDAQIRYKRFSNPNGPTYTMNKNEVFMIKYKNGEKDVFKDDPKPESAPAVNPASGGSVRLVGGNPPTAVTATAPVQQAVVYGGSAPFAVVPVNGGTAAEVPGAKIKQNPWPNKFKFGLNFGGGMEMLSTAWANDRYVTLTEIGWYINPKIYGEYVTGGKNGTLLGLAFGYNRANLGHHYEGQDEVDTYTVLDRLTLDIYAGNVLGKATYNSLTRQYEQDSFRSVLRYGIKLKMPVAGKWYYPGTGLELDITKNGLDFLAPAQASIFLDIMLHFGGFGLGFNFDYLFLGGHYNKKGHFSSTSSFGLGFGVSAEYSF